MAIEAYDGEMPGILISLKRIKMRKSIAGLTNDPSMANVKAAKIDARERGKGRNLLGEIEI